MIKPNDTVLAFSLAGEYRLVLHKRYSARGWQLGHPSGHQKNWGFVQAAA